MDADEIVRNAQQSLNEKLPDNDFLRDEAVKRDCDAALIYYILGDDGQIPTRFVAGELEGSEISPQGACDSVNVSDWIDANLLAGTDLIHVVSLSEEQGEVSSCQEKFKSPDKVSVDRIELKVDNNTLNLDFPASYLYLADGALETSTLSRDELNELIGNGTLQKVATLPKHPAGQTGSIAVQWDEASQESTFAKLLARDATLVFAADPIELMREVDGEDEYLLTPSGVLTISPTLHLTVRFDISDLGCIGELQDSSL